MTKPNRIGFMQGRLSPLIEGKIQAFPWPYWQDEFPLAHSIGLELMEWTIDQDRITENPLMTKAGRADIRRLSREHGITIPSLTGDCFMQAPFWKTSGRAQAVLVDTLKDLLEACADVGIRYIVVPLVDHGSLSSAHERKVLEDTLLDLVPMLAAHGQVIAFESDFTPAKVVEFMEGLPADRFGVNFDMGNSASLGWNPEEEIPLLAHRIVNVHVKDRVLGGTTVPLGTGSAELPKVFALLKQANYRGDYILQTARAADGEHLKTLDRYRALVASQIG